jgi:predicted Zn finger-like uncharacterized protein
MIIQCPACKTQAQLPASKEGAKVRCSECERVYVAHPPGSRAPSKGGFDPMKLVIPTLAVIAIGIIYVMVIKAPDKEYAIEEEEEAPRVVEAADSMGWDSPHVKFARELSDLVGAGDEQGLAARVDAEYVWRRRNEGFGGPIPTGKPGWVLEDEAKARADAGEPELEGPPTDDRAWALVSSEEKATFRAGVVADLLETELFTDWEPFNGWVVSDEPLDVIVRLQVSHRVDFELENRHVEWRFFNRNGKWKAWYWERWYTEDELNSYRRKSKGKTTKRTLSDGSIVIEGNVRPIPHDPETSVEDRARIDTLCSQLIDLEARPAVRTTANRELREIGKPALPALLTLLAETPLETEEDAIRLNLVHLSLGDITGYNTTFKVHELLGATRERQESGLKQWFGWYDRKYGRFEERKETGMEEVEALLDQFVPRSEKERKEFEQYKAERDG